MAQHHRLHECSQAIGLASDLVGLRGSISGGTLADSDRDRIAVEYGPLRCPILASTTRSQLRYMGHNIPAFSLLDRTMEEPLRPSIPPPRPCAPTPTDRHRPAIDEMCQLARARTVSSLGLPQVKLARDSPNRSSSAAMSDGRSKSTTSLLGNSIGLGSTLSHARN
jgi:hypothetical protein